MIDRQRGKGNVFLIGSALATLLVLVELVLHFYGKSICELQGCKVVAHQLRFGDYSLLIMGLLFFATLTILSVGSGSRRQGWAEGLINPLLIIALASEGYFVGYQVFAVHTLCVFCLVIFGCIVTLGVLRLLAGERALWVGFGCWLAVFSMFYLVLPATTTVTLPTQEPLILFYSKECKHCAEIRKELAEKKITVVHLEIGGYAGYLKSMGIENVPTLLVNERYHKEFLTGTEEIRRYLARREQGNQNAIGSSEVVPPSPEAPAELFNPAAAFPQPGLLPQPALPAVSTPSDDGMCKQETPCN